MYMYVLYWKCQPRTYVIISHQTLRKQTWWHARNLKTILFSCTLEMLAGSTSISPTYSSAIYFIVCFFPTGHY